MVNIGMGLSIIWPQYCVLCLDAATDSMRHFLGRDLWVDLPFCETCHSKVKRLHDWQGGVFMASFLSGCIGAIILLARGIYVDWLNLLRIATYLTALLTGLAVTGVTYALGWLLLVLLRIIFRRRLSHPGVFRLRSKALTGIQLAFSNPEYSRLFCEANAISFSSGNA